MEANPIVRIWRRWDKPPRTIWTPALRSLPTPFLVSRQLLAAHRQGLRAPFTTWLMTAHLHLQQLIQATASCTEPALRQSSTALPPSTKRGDGGVNSIDPAMLPRDPANNCNPVFPWNFVRTNTIFGVIHAAGGFT